MQAYSKPVRQGWGCGHEPPPTDGTPVMPWSGLGYTGAPPTVCPGYSTSLPETIEIARAWRWWDKGQLAQFCDGSSAADTMKLGIEIFAGAVSDLQRWLMKPREEGGGRE